MQKKVIVLSLTAVGIIILCFSVWFIFNRTNNDNPNSPNINSDDYQFVSGASGLQVTPVIEPTGETKEISAAGGDVQLDLTASATAKLALPAEALPGIHTIAINKISAITNLPAGMEFVSGVAVGPDGTLLDKPATLELTLPPDQLTDQIVGFAFSADGKEFHLQPIKLADGLVTMQLTGFSGYGVLVLPDNTTTPPAPTTIEMQAKQYIASIVLTSGKKTGSIDSDHLNKIKNILSGWYNSSVKPNLTVAINDETTLDAAVHEFISWQAMVQWFGLDSSFKSEIDQALNDIAMALNNASAKASKQCTAEKDPTQAVKLLHYSKMVQLLGLEGKAGISSDKINQQIKDCVNFELKITSNISSTASDVTTEVEASGTGAITFQDNMKLVGNAEVTVIRNQTVSMKPCTSNVPETWQINIPEFDLVTANTGAKFSLPIDLSLPVGDSLVWECGASLRDIVDDASVTIPISAWDFVLLHDDERVGELGESTSYLLPDWEMIGQGDVFAKKVYSRSINDPFGIGPITYHEKTTFELIPTPK